MLQRLCPGVSFVARQATYAAIRDRTGAVIDKGLVVYFCHPRSFTGEDSVEFQVTGSAAVVKSVLRALGECPGTRPAEAGEFAYRAFVNGKLDLLEVESLASVVEAETEAQLEFARKTSSGHVRRELDGVRETLLHALALTESHLDFSDAEDAAAAPPAQIWDLAAEAVRRLDALRRGAVAAERLRAGMIVAIAGRPNVGKSTLLNALARREAAIVSPHAGTTRDAIEVAAEVGGYPVLFVDTAGLRDAEDPVEQIGVARANTIISGAALTLWLTTLDDPAPIAADGASLRVVTKCDLYEPLSITDDAIWISAKTGAGLSDLTQRIADFATEYFDSKSAAGLWTGRQTAAAGGAAEALSRLLQGRGLPIEIVAEELRTAAAAVGRISGRIDVEEVLGGVFSRFCIGK